MLLFFISKKLISFLPGPCVCGLSLDGAGSLNMRCEAHVMLTETPFLKKWLLRQEKQTKKQQLRTRNINSMTKHLK